MLRTLAFLMIVASSSATLRLWAKKDFDPISSPMVESNQDCHCEYPQAALHRPSLISASSNACLGTITVF
jgi:hypothetical protein